MLEKLGPAFLAGLPSIVKPAAQTSYVTEAVVRRIVGSGLVPEGSVQLLMGSPAGLLDELRVQDHVAFTGSAHTAGLLRTHTNVLHGGVTLGVEADSLNCSILGPDVTADDPELDLFVKAVVTEMTQKAGQKCTAIRRTLVPAGLVDPVLEALTARLSRTTVGHPAAEGVRMGALVSLDQRDEVRKAIAVAARLRRPRVRRPRARRGDRGRRGARCVPRPGAPARRRHRRRAARRGGVRTGQHGHRLRLTRRGDRPGGARQGQPGRLGRHPRPGRRARDHPGPGALARPDPGPRPRRRRRVHRPRRAAADPRARRPGAGRRRRGDGGPARRPAPDAAHRPPGLAGHADRDHRPLDQGRAASRRRRAPLPQEPGRAAHRRHDRLAPRVG